MSPSRVIVSLVLLLLLIGGCSKNDRSSSSGTTITFWHSFVASTVPALNELLQQFEKEHPGIVVKAQYVPTGDALVQKLATAVQSRTAPDIAWIHADFLDQLVGASALLPLDSIIRSNNGMTPEEVADILPPLLDAGKYQGTQYALPMEATSLALIYNRELFRAAGLDPDHPPANWDELRSYAGKLTVDHNGDGITDQYGFYVPVFPASGDLNIWMVLQWLPFLWQAGGREVTPDGRLCLNSDAAVEALSLWKQIYHGEEFSRFGIAHDIGFASGKLAMVMDGPWNLPRYRAMSSVDWRVAPLPAGPAKRATYVAGELLAIFRQSEHSDAAWTFVKWILEPRVQAQFSMRSGYLPVRRSTRELPEYRAYLKSDEALRAFVEQMDVGMARLTFPRRVEVNRVVAEAIERATLGNEDPRACLNEAQGKAEKILSGGERSPK
jgi:multiple sugar transport system substrate-binding protein